MTSAFKVYAIKGIPLIDDKSPLTELIYQTISDSEPGLSSGDVVVVAQKIISKAEGRMVRLAEVEVSDDARELAKEVDKDPRLVQLILQESSQIVRTAPGVIIVRHHLGIVCANAGIDQSNIDHSDGECALLLPLDPDHSAQQLRDRLMTLSGKHVSVIISDSINRPWRLGTVGITIGSAGLSVLDDRRGQGDMFGRELKVTMSNNADAIASSAMLVMGETTEKIPVALVRGLSTLEGSQQASDCVRPASEDLFL